MSYDVAVECKLRDYDEWVEVTESLNTTYNLSKMYSEACGSKPSEWHLKPVVEVLPDLISGLEQLRRRPNYYARFVPENGWGTVGSAQDFLVRLIANCERYEKGRIYTS